jgi:hypothetical protein
MSFESNPLIREGAVVIIPRSILTSAEHPYLESAVIERIEDNRILVNVLSMDRRDRQVRHERMWTTVDAAIAGTEYFYYGKPITKTDLRRYVAQIRPAEHQKHARSDHSQSSSVYH